MVAETHAIDSASPTRNIALANLLRAKNSPGRVSVPLQAGVSYMRLRHVLGVPAAEGTSGFSLSRLRLLDTMIERLERSAQNGRGTTGTAPAVESHPPRLGRTGSTGSAGLRAADPGSSLNLLV